MTYPDDAPRTVLTDRERTALYGDLQTWGAWCIECGREASPYELDCLLDDVLTDPEPAPFLCGATDCGDRDE